MAKREPNIEDYIVFIAFKKTLVFRPIRGKFLIEQGLKYYNITDCFMSQRDFEEIMKRNGFIIRADGKANFTLNSKNIKNDNFKIGVLDNTG